MARRINSRVAEMIDAARRKGELVYSPSAQCRVCLDPAVRELVNTMLSCGYALTDIYRTLGPINAARPKKKQVTYFSVRNHRENHFKMQALGAEVYREIAEKHYVAYGGDLQTGVGSIVTAMGFFETAMQRSYETLTDPETPVSIEVGMSAAAKYAELQRKDEGLQERAAMLARMNQAIALVQKYVAKEDWPALQAELRGETVMQEAALASAEPRVRMVEISDIPDEDEDPHH